MEEQRVLEELPYGARVEIGGSEVYVPRLIPVKGGRIVRYLNGPPEWRAVLFTPATKWKRAEWELQHLTDDRAIVPEAQDVFCRAEDNPGEA